MNVNLRFASRLRLMSYRCILLVSFMTAADRAAYAFVIGESDRRTESEWAQDTGVTLDEVRVRYAATGIVRCNRTHFSANLVLVNDLIVTTAHGFINPKTCEKASDFQTCRFTVRSGRQSHVSELDSIVASGLRCPTPGSGGIEDWAVVRLKRKIIGVTPYMVDANEAIRPEQKITSVAAINSDLFRGNTRLADETKSIGRCMSQNVFRHQGENVYFSSDCDGSKGASGGAILKDDEPATPPVLLGIHESSRETAAQLEEAIRNNEPNKRDFDEKKWSNYHIAIRGVFLTDLLKAASRRAD